MDTGVSVLRWSSGVTVGRNVLLLYSWVLQRLNRKIVLPICMSSLKKNIRSYTLKLQTSTLYFDDENRETQTS